MGLCLPLFYILHHVNVLRSYTHYPCLCLYTAPCFYALVLSSICFNISCIVLITLYASLYITVKKKQRQPRVNQYSSTSSDTDALLQEQEPHHQSSAAGHFAEDNEHDGQTPSPTVINPHRSSADGHFAEDSKQPRNEVERGPGINITINNPVREAQPTNESSRLDATIGIPGVASITVRNLLKGVPVFILVAIIALAIIAVAIVFIVRELKE